LTFPVEKAKNQAMRLAATLAALVLAGACGGDKGVEDEALGGLVVNPKAATPIDIESAVKDPAELTRALANPHRAVIAALGPHTLTIETRTVVEENGKLVSELSDRAELEVGDNQTFHGVYTNNADYGREAIFIASAGGGGKLYLRPRYQKWHGRAPESPDEPAQIRDGYFAAIAATWDLVAPGAELTERGTTTVAGRAGRKVAVKLSPTVREMPRETLSQRHWRETRSITALDGDTLDADKGVPLAAKLTATVSFSREGRRFAMKLGLDASVTKIGSVSIAAPAEGEVVATPTRRGEVDERDYLLHGIAPPIKKNKDGTAAKPMAPGVGSGLVGRAGSERDEVQRGEARWNETRRQEARREEVGRKEIRREEVGRKEIRREEVGRKKVGRKKVGRKEVRQA
jgi:hypothetical protein